MTEALTCSVPDAARSLGVAPRTVWNLIAKGELPVVKIGGRTLIATRTLALFAAERETTR